MFEFSSFTLKNSKELVRAMRDGLFDKHAGCHLLMTSLWGDN